MTVKGTKEILQAIQGWKDSGRPLVCDDCDAEAEFILRHGGSPFSWWLQCKEHAAYVKTGKRAPRYYIQQLSGDPVESDMGSISRQT